MTLGERMQLLRRRKGWTHEDLATKIGVTPNTLSRIERGETPNPHVNIVRQLADAFGTSTDYLLGRREDSGVEPQAGGHRCGPNDTHRRTGRRALWLRGEPRRV